MNIKLIKTEEDYQVALKRLEVVFDAKLELQKAMRLIFLD